MPYSITLFNWLLNWYIQLSIGSFPQVSWIAYNQWRSEGGDEWGEPPQAALVLGAAFSKKGAAFSKIVIFITSFLASAASKKRGHQLHQKNFPPGGTLPRYATACNTKIPTHTHTHKISMLSLLLSLNKIQDGLWVIFYYFLSCIVAELHGQNLMEVKTVDELDDLDT